MYTEHLEAAVPKAHKILYSFVYHDINLKMSYKVGLVKIQGYSIQILVAKMKDRVANGNISCLYGESPLEVHVTYTWLYTI